MSPGREPLEAAPGQPDDPQTLTVGVGGIDEVAFASWAAVIRHRLAGRVRVDRRVATMVVILSGLFTATFTITILAVSLSGIASDLDTSVGVVTWAITGPMLAFGVVGPAYGKLGDLHGHKRVFLFGLAGAGLFAGLTALAWNGTSMVVFRLISATAGAATGPATVAFITRLYPVTERVRPLGWWTFVNAGGPVLGVVAGAPLVEAFGWRAIFAVQAPLCLVGVVMAWILLPDTHRRPEVRFDLAGSVALGGGAVSILAAISQGPQWGWTSPLTLGLVVTGLGLAVVFVRVERRVAEPLMPLRWLRTRNVALPVATQSLANFAYMGGFLLAPLLLEESLGYRTATIGLIVIARPLAFALVATLAGSITVRVGERAAALAGTTAVVASMVTFAWVRPDTALVWVVVALALSGLGFGISAPALTSLVASAVDEHELGVAGALQQLMSQMGAVAGTVLMTTVQQASNASVASSFTAAFVLGGAVACLAVLTAANLRPLRR